MQIFGWIYCISLNFLIVSKRKGIFILNRRNLVEDIGLFIELESEDLVLEWLGIEVGFRQRELMVSLDRELLQGLSDFGGFLELYLFV